MDEQTTGAGSQVAKPRTYTDEYRRRVVDMVTSTGRTAMSVAAELGIHHTLISRWWNGCAWNATSSKTTAGLRSACGHRNGWC